MNEEAEAARDEWFKYSAKDTKEEPPPLLVKEPQLAAAKAKLDADRAQLRKARLDLERTELRAPFAGRVSTVNVGIGQYVTPGQALATLFPTEAVEIILPLENKDLYWFHVPGFTSGTGPGALARIHAPVAGRKRSWNGRVVRTEGKLDQRTRMVNVVVRVEEPYRTKPPLAVGLFVNVDIEGRTLPQAALLPRSALHQGNVVWVIGEDGRLSFRNVEVARKKGEAVLIGSGLRDGETVAVSPLKAVSDGMMVRAVADGQVDREKVVIRKKIGSESETARP
jgi:RND family efflux transporter MFP subunit